MQDTVQMNKFFTEYPFSIVGNNFLKSKTGQNIISYYLKFKIKNGEVYRKKAVLTFIISNHPYLLQTV